MRLFVAEDEPDLLNITIKRLKAAGYAADGCQNGDQALYYLENTPYDLAILDIMMPGKDGITLLKELRRKGRNFPVLLLTARDGVQNRVAGLDAGADDYLAKPYAFDELLARIRALLRRGPMERGDILSVDDLIMDVSKHIVTRGGKEISLSAKEFSILEYLMRNQGAVMTRTQVENHVWDYDFEGGSNIVDVYVRYLRKKIDDAFDIKLIRTVRGVGYLIQEPEKS